MPLKTFKPYTKSTRGTILVSREGLWKGKPFKALTSQIIHQRVETIMGGSLQEIMEVDINTNIDKLIFIEKN
tara:strand:- start:245 stop:460 length:216 start_codon:yes stop_codon:yes gene_type:complete